MSGTKAGGLKAARTNLERHGNGFYARIGAKGGQNGHTGGFAANHELAKIAGRKGGRISSRKGIRNGDGKRWKQHRYTYKTFENGKTITKINVKYVPTN